MEKLFPVEFVLRDMPFDGQIHLDLHRDGSVFDLNPFSSLTRFLNQKRTTCECCRCNRLILIVELTNLAICTRIARLWISTLTGTARSLIWRFQAKTKSSWSSRTFQDELVRKIGNQNQSIRGPAVWRHINLKKHGKGPRAQGGERGKNFRGL